VIGRVGILDPIGTGRRVLGQIVNDRVGISGRIGTGRRVRGRIGIGRGRGRIVERERIGRLRGRNGARIGR
jgi:hypothetical protein